MDDRLEAFEDMMWQEMENSGVSAEEVAKARQRKRFKEDSVVLSAVVRDENTPREDRLVAAVSLAVALEGLSRRSEAISQLSSALNMFGDESSIALALAKLLFRDNQKELAEDICNKVLRSQIQCSGATTGSSLADTVGWASKKQMADAYYISGWIAIHGDNHTKAYRVWQEGFRKIPDDNRLVRQDRKRSCWDCADAATNDYSNGSMPLDVDPLCQGLLGHGECPSSQLLISDDLDNARADVAAYSVKAGAFEPALSLFDRDAQQRRVVFKTKKRVLTPGECGRVLEHVNSYIENRGGSWGTVRECTVPTTDVAVEDIPVLRPWLRELMRTRLKPMLAECFPVLADGSTLGPNGERVRVHDAFIVRYDATRDMSLSLPEHCDTSVFSFTLALNDGNTSKNGNFEGGGTWFQALDPPNGGVVNAGAGEAVAFAGPLRHAGYPITAGTRVILVLFLYVDGFSYGSLLTAAIEEYERNVNVATEDVEHNKAGGGEDESDTLPSGTKKGGFVVYRETVELMNALDLEK
jgi:hypothetical protein